MNELQLIQRQVDLERGHFLWVARACARGVGLTGSGYAAPFVSALIGYLDFALARLSAEPRLEAQLRELASSTDPRAWQSFAQEFNAIALSRFAVFDDLQARKATVAEWRATSGIDADSIVLERTLHTQLIAALPPGVNLDSARLGGFS